MLYVLFRNIQLVIHSLYTFIHQTYTLYMSYTLYWAIFNLIHSLYTFIHQIYTLYMWHTRHWAIFNRWYIAYTLLYIRHTPCTCHIHGIGTYSTIDTYLIHFYTSDIHPVHVVYAILGHIQSLIHSFYTFIHQKYTLYMSYTRYWAIFNHWYIAYTLLYIRHTPCKCRIHGIGKYSTGDT